SSYYTPSVRYERLKIDLPAARVIKRFRQRAGISQDRLAAEAAVDRSTVNVLERLGKDVRLSTMNALLVGLGRTWTDFGVELDGELANAKENRNTADRD